MCISGLYEDSVKIKQKRCGRLNSSHQQCETSSADLFGPGQGWVTLPKLPASTQTIISNSFGGKAKSRVVNDLKQGCKRRRINIYRLFILLSHAFALLTAPGSLVFVITRQSKLIGVSVLVAS
ncbi:MAG: hypothetical protein FRX49_12593 [Trebouxia sp. A1-2]|nr:MAG: hypothetical protein FRX49_12593 [Trebouxia sp. A1-2]